MPGSLRIYFLVVNLSLCLEILNNTRLITIFNTTISFININKTTGTILMTDIVLTKAEIKSITGTPVRRRQAEILLLLKIPYRIRQDGNIVISRLAYEQAMGCLVNIGINETLEPDFDSLNVS